MNIEISKTESKALLFLLDEFGVDNSLDHKIKEFDKEIEDITTIINGPDTDRISELIRERKELYINRDFLEELREIRVDIVYRIKKERGDYI